MTGIGQIGSAKGCGKVPVCRLDREPRCWYYWNGRSGTGTAREQEMGYSRERPATSQHQESRENTRTPTFLLELPLHVHESQAKRLRAHLEAGRQFYNAVLSEGLKRLRRMRADPGWQAARALPRSQKQERAAAFRALREQYGFSEYAMHEAGKRLRCPGSLSSWTRCLPKPWPAGPTTPSTGSASDTRSGCASAVVVVASPVSKTSGMTPGCALCCRSRRRETRDSSSGETTTW